MEAREEIASFVHRSVAIGIAQKGDEIARLLRPAAPPWAIDMIQPRITSLGRETGSPDGPRDWTTSTSPLGSVWTVRGLARSFA